MVLYLIDAPSYDLTAMSSPTASSSPSCDVCGKLNDDKTDSFDFTTIALTQSAVGGCGVCEILKTSLTHARPDFLHNVDKVKVKRTKDKPLELVWNVKGLPSTEIVEIYSHAGEYALSLCHTAANQSVQTAQQYIHGPVPQMKCPSTPLPTTASSSSIAGSKTA